MSRLVTRFASLICGRPSYTAFERNYYDESPSANDRNIASGRVLLEWVVTAALPPVRASRLCLTL